MANHKKYIIKLTSASKRDLNKLPFNVQCDLLKKHFPKLESNPFVFSRMLHGHLKGSYSYHFGHHPEYRIVFRVIKNHLIILIIGSRENFYKEAYRRLTKMTFY